MATHEKHTYHVDELRQTKSQLNGEFVSVIANRTDQFVVAAAYQYVVVQSFGVGISNGSCACAQGTTLLPYLTCAGFVEHKPYARADVCERRLRNGDRGSFIRLRVRSSPWELG
jgi:hypothetical protein